MEIKIFTQAWEEKIDDFMSLKNLSFALLVFIFLLSNASNALTVNRIDCYDNGKIVMVSICNEYNENISTDSINVLAKYGSSNLSLISGAWDYKIIPPCNGQGSASFGSKEALFNLSGYYNITVKYPNNEANFTTKFCPGLAFSCSLIDIKIDRCYTKQGYLYTFFNLTNAIQPQKSINLYTDLGYNINGKYGWMFSTLPENTTISNLNDTRYLFQAFVGYNNTINSVEIKTNVCSDTTYPNTRNYNICGKEPKCTSDAECLGNEICNASTQYCETLKCEKGTPSQHMCIECSSDKDCNDSLFCTNDKCIDEKCIHETLGCLSNETCVIGTCVEPNGCRYSVDEKCVQSKILRSNSTSDQYTNNSFNDTSTNSRNIGIGGFYIVALIVIIIIAVLVLWKLKFRHKQKR